ncbi:hypothetical protein [Nocardia sp. NPDC057440]|uniref:hypothetical protein n=1 Tax=Nocardia sp. NPDC057440 TaxID=3346134 RepID=UPI00366D8DA9
MFEIHSRRAELAPSVAALLALFHEDTPQKLALAPDDSPAILHHADGTLSQVGEDGWPTAGP